MHVDVCACTLELIFSLPAGMMANTLSGLPESVPFMVSVTASIPTTCI